MRNLELAALRDRLASSLWFLSAVGVVVAGTAAALLSRIGLGDSGGQVGFGGTPDGARAIVSTVAASVITVASVTFSLTVVALQVASSQFSPRILRSFLSDRGNQVVLATFLSTFSFSLVTLRGIRGAGQGEGSDPFVPDWAVGGTVVMAALSVAMLVYFIHHLTRQLRVEAILEDLQGQALDTIHHHLPEDDGTEDDLPEVPEDAVTLRARSSGYLQTIDGEQLLAVAVDNGVVIRLRPRIGGPLTKGATLAWAWPVNPETEIRAEAVDDLADEVADAVLVGFERSMRQDVAFGIRQMVDIAVRALSPGVNDPATAVATLGALAPVVAELCRRRSGHVVRADEHGRIRVGIDEPTFGELLALTCDQPRRYATDEPAVLLAILELLADVAELDPPSREAVEHQVKVTLDAARSRNLSRSEVDNVERVARRASQTLDVGDRVAEESEDDEPDAPAE